VASPNSYRHFLGVIASDSSLERGVAEGDPGVAETAPEWRDSRVDFIEAAVHRGLGVRLLGLPKP
jgi:hypothetical protein